jgi:hypothetical protein
MICCCRFNHVGWEIDLYGRWGKVNHAGYANKNANVQWIEISQERVWYERYLDRQEVLIMKQ